MKKEKLEELFRVWRQKECFAENGTLGQFVPDGIVDYATFEKVNKKVLFVLKDPHDADGKYEARGICDEVLHSTNSGKTWNPVAIWARGLLKRNETFMTVDALKAEDCAPDEIDGIRKYFKNIAIMNLKKVSGGSTAKDIEYFAKCHAEEMRKEIEIIEPDIIIACGDDVYDLLVEVVLGLDLKMSQVHKVDLSEKMANYGHFVDVAECFDRKAPMYLVHYRHPSICWMQESYENHFLNMQKIARELLGN